jgi:hypothetical protein
MCVYVCVAKDVDRNVLNCVIVNVCYYLFVEAAHDI